MLALALGRLGLAPATFWALSLPEWRAVLTRLPGQASVLARGELDRMMKEFPDG